jgi:hypothetical protein
MEDAVEPREDLLGHLGHIAVDERAWLTVSRVLIGELARSLKSVLEAWSMLPETCVGILYAIMMYCTVPDGSCLDSTLSTSASWRFHSVADAPSQQHQPTSPLLPSTTITTSAQNAIERQEKSFACHHSCLREFHRTCSKWSGSRSHATFDTWTKLTFTSQTTLH